MLSYKEYCHQDSFISKLSIAAYLIANLIFIPVQLLLFWLHPVAALIVTVLNELVLVWYWYDVLKQNHRDSYEKRMAVEERCESVQKEMKSSSDINISVHIDISEKSMVFIRRLNVRLNKWFDWDVMYWVITIGYSALVTGIILVKWQG